MVSGDGSNAAWAEQYTFHHENVLGTSMQLVVRTGSAAEAALVEQTVLAEIDRLARIFSAHDSGSELMRWQAGQLNDDQVSPELVAVLSRAEHWRRQTAGAFDVRALVFSRIWKSAAKQQRLPDREAMKAIVGELGQAPYRIVGDRVERVDSMPITLDALAKGYILEAACREVVRVIRAWKVEFDDRWRLVQARCRARDFFYQRSAFAGLEQST